MPLPAPAASGEDAEELPADKAAPPSRELLAVGLPFLAEDAAESERSLDALFSAALAAEKGDHRRATAILKARYPELGTPEDGAVPRTARRAYYPRDHAALIEAGALKSKLPPALLFALIRQESLFQPDVKSRVGALGLMQLMPATGRMERRLEGGKGRPDLRNPVDNVRLGADYLARLLNLFDGDTAAALAGYNGGPGRVLRWKREMGALERDAFLESIPLSETRDYVKKVLFFEGAYAALYGIGLEPAPPTIPPTPLPSAPRL